MTRTMTVLAALLVSCTPALAADFSPKVMVITMFGGEAAPWLENMDLAETIAVPGLSQEYPEVHCSADLCVMTTAMGFANAASSVSALIYDGRFDFSQTYFLIAGIAGVDPSQGTLGSAHWARFVVDGGLRHQIDPREIPEDWNSGAIGLGASTPDVPAEWAAGTELYELNEALTQAAFEASKDVELADDPTAQTYRANYDQEAAQRTPFVSICDTVSGDTYWHGELIANDMNNIVERLTDGEGTYCTTQMEDNATLTALQRGAQAGRLDFGRVAVLRTASNFDRAAPGQTTPESLAADSGGFGPSTQNAYRVGRAFADTVIANWESWAGGVPGAAN
jgi:purine nucleoside permease